MIKKHEGLRLRAYLCPGLVWTIGYGHTSTARQGMEISGKRAEELLIIDLRAAEAVVEAKLPGINQSQFDALVSFVFNIGATNFLRSTLVRKILSGSNENDIRDEFRRWIYANRKIAAGLVKRRQDEADLYYRINQ